MWNNQYFELDRYKGTNDGLIILEVEQLQTNKEQDVIVIPPFISIYKKITGNPRYSTKRLAIKRSSSASVHT